MDLIESNDRLDILEIKSVYEKLQYLFTKIDLLRDLSISTNLKEEILDGIWEDIYKLIMEHHQYIKYIESISVSTNNLKSCFACGRSPSDITFKKRKLSSDISNENEDLMLL